ncbi:molybdopterin molybdotransferase MoeA [Desulfurococcaceae archaeon MEX13E-LK6-19]|nr:molybdopterin molybdotransferase MoeA [Desulfurococcaceae archaeon MEX13E-LK6-19]
MGDVLERLYKYMDPREAVNVLASGLGPIGVEEVDIRNAVGRILAEDIVASTSRPWTDLSHVDGFAVRSVDTSTASSRSPVKLKIVRNVDSRNAHNYKIKEGEAVFVETGYPVPEGADAVYPIESVRVGEDFILVFRPARSGENIIHKGSDVKTGTLIAQRGTRITPLLQKLLIDLGIPCVKVYKKPRVAIVPTGDEIVDEVVAVSTGKIPMSSAYLLRNVLEYWGCSISSVVKARDEPREIINVIDSLLEGNDIIVSIGGVSMGPKDYSWITLYKHYKPEKYVRGIKVHPGRSTSGLRVNDKIVVNLPGLPQSTISGLIFLLLPIITRLQGGNEFKLPYIDVLLKETIEVKAYPAFYRVRLAEIDYETMEAIVHAKTESYNVYPLVKADGFTVIPPRKTIVEKGSNIKVFYLEPLFSFSKTSILTKDNVV